MKFLCIDCDEVMGFAERQLPGDGTMAAVYLCGGCGREIALLTNPMETRLVSSMGVKVGGRKVPEQPMELTRSNLEEARPEAFEVAESGGPGGADPSPGAEPPGAAGSGSRENSPERGEGERAEASGVAAAPSATAARPGGPHEEPRRVRWSGEASERLERVPSFVRGMVKRIYTDWARDRQIETITPEVMDRARTDLGLEGM